MSSNSESTRGSRSAQFMMRISTDLMNRLEVESSVSRRSINAIVNLALHGWLSSDPKVRSIADAEEIKLRHMGDKLFTARVDGDLRNQLKITSSQLGLSMNTTLLGIIDNWLIDEPATASATLQIDGACSIEIPPQLFRDVSKLVPGAGQAEAVRMCLRELCFSSVDATVEMSALLEASFVIVPASHSDGELIDKCRKACVAGGAKDALSRVRLRFALIQCLGRVGVRLDEDANGETILGAMKDLPKRQSVG